MMEKFPENQNNNSESEKPKAAEKVSFKNKLKRIFGTSAAIGATALMVGCGKGNDANAINNTPVHADDSPKTESNIEDAGITTSQDVDTVDFGDGTSVDVSDNGSTSEIAVEEESNGEVDPAKYWEGDTFHLDEYAEALGYEIRPGCILYRYGDSDNTKFSLFPIEERIRIKVGEETKVEAGYGVTNPSEAYHSLREGDINIEFSDSVIGKSSERLNEYIETLQWFANTDDPYSFEESFDYWHAH